MTTNVVACTSFHEGHVTRFISFRTSERKVRLRPHQATTPFGLVAVSRTRSSIADFKNRPRQ
jgi:hypothetical protein